MFFLCLQTIIMKLYTNSQCKSSICHNFKAPKKVPKACIMWPGLILVAAGRYECMYVCMYVCMHACMYGVFNVCESDFHPPRVVVHRANYGHFFFQVFGVQDNQNRAPFQISTNVPGANTAAASTANENTYTIWQHGEVEIYEDVSC